MEAFVGLLALAVTLLALLAAIFPGNRRGRLKVSLLAFSIFVAALVWGGDKSSPTRTVTSNSVEGRPDQSETPVPPPPVAVKINTPAEDYLASLEVMIPLAENYDAKSYTEDVTSVLFGANLLQTFLTTYESGNDVSLPADIEATRQKFLDTVRKKQAHAMPVLRDAYGPALRNALWEADGKAKTFGNGFRTIEIISASFAANRNIKAAHIEMIPILMLLRFNRAQYKWLDANVEYSFYTLEPPADNALVIFNKQGQFRPIKSR